MLDLLSLADELAEIAGTTTDADTGRRTMVVVARLLSVAGLPGGTDELPGSHDGGTVNAAAYA